MIFSAGPWGDMKRFDDELYELYLPFCGCPLSIRHAEPMRMHAYSTVTSNQANLAR